MIALGWGLVALGIVAVILGIAALAYGHATLGGCLFGGGMIVYCAGQVLATPRDERRY